MENNKRYWLDLLTRYLGDSIIDVMYEIYRVMLVREHFYKDMSVDTLYSDMKVEPSRLYELANTLCQTRPSKVDEKSFYNLYIETRELSKRDCLEYFDYLASKEGRRSDFSPVPKTLLNTLIPSFDKDNIKVFIPDCEKYGTFLYDFASENRERFVFTSCRNLRLKEIYSHFYDHSNIRFLDGDYYTFGFTNEKFDLIICFPIMGGRSIFEGHDFISKEPSLIAAQNLLYHLTQNGVLKIILPAKVTFAGGDAESFRNFVESNYKINEISSLPSKLFQPFLFINTYLFSFSNGVTEDIKLRKYSLEKVEDGSALKVDNEQIIFKDEFEDIPAWNIDSVFNADDPEIIVYNNSKVKKSPIGLVASVFRGKAITTKEENGNISIINISNINDTEIDYTSLETFNEDERKTAKYFLEDGDVLVTSRGTTVKIGVFEKQDKPCVASANINVIRPSKMIKGTYLKLFLDSSVGKKMLKALQRGTTIVNINFKDIETLEVPVSPLNEQEEIVSDYIKGRDAYVEAIRQAEESWQNLQKELERKLY